MRRKKTFYQTTTNWNLKNWAATTTILSYYTVAQVRKKIVLHWDPNYACYSIYFYFFNNFLAFFTYKNCISIFWSRSNQTMWRFLIDLLTFLWGKCPEFPVTVFYLSLVIGFVRLRVRFRDFLFSCQLRYEWRTIYFCFRDQLINLKSVDQSQWKLLDFWYWKMHKGNEWKWCSAFEILVLCEIVWVRMFF